MPESVQSDPDVESSTPMAPRSRDWMIIGLLVFVSATTNFLWVLQHLKDQKVVTPNAYYAKNTPETIKTAFDFQWFDFDNNSRVLNDHLWMSDMPSSGGMVTITSDEASSLGLDDSIIDPYDSGKMIYLMAAYHQVHCLVLLKDTVMAMNTTSPETLNWGHLLHCIDALRQAAWCNLDTTILRVNGFEVTQSEKYNGPVDGQIHVCTNRMALKAWTEEHAWHDVSDPPAKV